MELTLTNCYRHGDDRQMIFLAVAAALDLPELRA